MAMKRACDARVEMDGAFFSVQRFMVGSSVQPIRVSNTEGKPGNSQASADNTRRGYAAKLGDEKEGRIRLVNATWDDEENPWSSTINLIPGTYHDVKVYPDGAGEVHSYTNCLLVSTSHEGAIPGGQPVTMEFETDGYYVEATG